MKCNEARKITYLSEYPEVVTEDMMEAKRHVRECPECRMFFEQERAFASLLRDKAAKDKAPAELRQRLLEAEPAKKMHSGLMYKIISIAAILMLVAGGYIFKLYSDTESMVEKIVNDHINFLSYSGIQVTSSRSDEIKAWFGDRVDFSVNVPELKAALKGARLCLLDKKRLALLFYEHNGSQISLFVTTELDTERLLSGEEVIVKDKKVRIVEQKGYNLLLWQERGISYALVSDLSIDKLKKII
ncbi:MAG: DUF4367 domain-containing protein [Nitrospirae bacterium]|nr:DUF4367 domain-containing protein [Nitrospirota bacterium]